jgi:hypothetical protein
MAGAFQDAGCRQDDGRDVKNTWQRLNMIATMVSSGAKAGAQGYFTISRDDQVYLAYIRDALQQITTYTEGTDYTGFIGNRMVQDAVIQQFEIGMIL